MGYAERLNRSRLEKNGTEIPPPASDHLPWCLRTTVLDSPGMCTCDRPPALKCNDCGRVFTPAPYEAPRAYARRVRAHAMLHPTPPGFTPGRVERTPKKQEGTEP
jgi:hypothetical protein